MSDWAPDVQNVDIGKVGERSTFEDALYGTAMSAVEPTVTVAEQVAAAVMLGTKNPANSEEESINRRVIFARDIMNAHAAEAGATNTVFMNEHGGDLPVKDGIWQGLPKASARDFVFMWNHFVTEDPRFLQILGLRDYEHTTLTPSLSSINTYKFSKWYGYYPKIEGDKSGGVTPQGVGFEYTSLVGSSKRLGRRLVFDVMESDNGSNFKDTAEILAYSFARIFTPKKVGENGGHIKIIDQAVDSFGSDRFVSAFLDGDGELGFSTWQVASGAVSHLWSSPELAVTYLPGEAPPPKNSSIDVSYLGDLTPQYSVPKRVFVTIIRKNDANQTVVLSTWHITNNNTVLPLKSNEWIAGMAPDVAIERLSNNQFVSAARRSSDGKLQLHSYSVDNAGKIAHFGWSGSNKPRSRISLVQIDVAKYATAGSEQSPDGPVVVNLWRIGHQGGSGSITQMGEMGPYPGDVTGTALSSIKPGGVVLASQGITKLGLSPMEYHQRFKDDNGNEDYFKLGLAAAEKAEMIDIAILSSSSGKGTYVTSFKTSAEKLKVIVWNIGK
jgi:hypothetical protein